MGNKNVTCKIKLFKPVVKQLTEALAPALEKTAEAVHTDLEQSQKMPFSKGTLQNESTFIDDAEVKNGSVYLVSSTPYARRLYYHPEYHFDKSENPNAGGRWLADYLPGGRKEDFAQEAFNRFYKQEADL
ncbi:MAG: hypothetical protein IJ379_05200 [Lachnospiraceae bacterium]|nr:hypothetical protein [Lachnospiraceae bacterium]